LGNPNRPPSGGRNPVLRLIPSEARCKLATHTLTPANRFAGSGTQKGARQPGTYALPRTVRTWRGYQIWSDRRLHALWILCLARPAYCASYIRFEGWYPDVEAKSLVLSSNCFRLARGFSSKFARCFFNQQGSTEASEILGFRRKPYIQRKCSRQSLHDPKYCYHTLELHGRVCAPVGLFNAQGQLCPNCFICVSEPFALHSIEI